MHVQPLVSLPSSIPEEMTRHAGPGQTLEVNDQVARQFEAVFLSMLVKEMRQSLEEGLFGSENSDSFGALFDLHLGDHLAQGPGLGVRQMLRAQYLNTYQDAQQSAVATEGQQNELNHESVTQVDG